MDTKKSDLPRLELFGLSPLLGYVVTRIAEEMRMLEKVKDLDDRLSECLEFSVLLALKERSVATNNDPDKDLLDDLDRWTFTETAMMEILAGREIESNIAAAFVAAHFRSCAISGPPAHKVEYMVARVQTYLDANPIDQDLEFVGFIYMLLSEGYATVKAGGTFFNSRCGAIISGCLAAANWRLSYISLIQHQASLSWPSK